MKVSRWKVFQIIQFIIFAGVSIFLFVRQVDGSVKKLSETTVNGVYRLLRKILNKAVAWDYIETNPVLKVKTPEVSKKRKAVLQSRRIDENIRFIERRRVIN